MDKKLLLLVLAAVIGLTSAFFKPKFSYKTYGNIASFFENENDFRSFFDFHKGDIVAEIGAGRGYNMYGFNIVADSVTFYVQDIDTNVLSTISFTKLIKHFQKLKKPQTNTFHRCIGTVSGTTLPDNSFDKIILVSAFHEFTFMYEMLTDIHKKLKPNGQLYILEAHCHAPGHKNYTADQAIDLLKKHNFTLVKKDGRDINNSTGLYRTIFKKAAAVRN